MKSLHFYVVVFKIIIYCMIALKWTILQIKQDQTWNYYLCMISLKWIILQIKMQPKESLNVIVASSKWS